MRTYRSFTMLMLTAGIPLAGAIVMSAEGGKRNVNGAIWVANRGANTIQGFDAGDGTPVGDPVPMRAGSQPGDLAYANHKLYVAEERATPPAIAIVDPTNGAIINRLMFPNGSRPHHVHATVSGELVAVGLYGTDQIAVVETENDTLLGTWRDPSGPTARVHAGVFSQDGETLYFLNDATGKLTAMDPRTGTVLWFMDVPGAHEMIVTPNNKTAFVSRRPLNRLALVDLEAHTYRDVLEIGLPDTFDMSANQKLLTLGLRTSPARMAVVDVDSLIEGGAPSVEVIDLAPAGAGTTTGGHQWTTPNGQYTFAAYEGAMSAGLVVIDHRDGNKVVQRIPYAGAPHGVTHVPQ
jgi:hypothetical protein